MTDKRKSILRESIRKLKQLPNVVGAGLGKKIKNGVIQDEDVLHVFVHKKLPKHRLNKKEMIPDKIWNKYTTNPIKTDVIAIGKLKPYTDPVFINRDTIRPMPGGVSTDNPLALGIGTLGGILRDTTDDKPVIVTNNHVYARENAASVGETVRQAAPESIPGTPGGTVGVLKRFGTIDFNILNDNLTDYAIADLDTGFTDYDIGITHVGVPRGVNTSPQINDIVHKSGRTTEYTTGLIISTDAEFPVSYDGGDAYFVDQILTTTMSSPGDSGSLVLDAENNLVGLLFAGSTQITALNPIQAIIDQAEVLPWTLPKIVAFKNPVRGGYFFRDEDDVRHDPQYTLNHGSFFFLYPLALTNDDTVELKRWKTISYPTKYAVGVTPPGAGYLQDRILGRIATTELHGSVPLFEWVDSSRNNRFYSTDIFGQGIDTSIFVQEPAPIGYVMNIHLGPLEF